MSIKNLKSPTDILISNPDLNWNVRELGYLLMLGLVDGVKLPRTCLLSEIDVLNLYEQIKPARRKSRKKQNKR